MRSLLNISRGTLRGVLYLILVGVLLFFGLTRTQVGRDSLRLQLMHSFDADFTGRLQIDRLHGNLVNELFAGGVRLYDEKDELVLSVDSVVATPRWRDLFERKVSVGRLTLHQPKIHITRDQEGNWNLKEAVRRVVASGSTDGDPWSFSSLDVEIRDGEIVTENESAVPTVVSSGFLFDYANARATDVDLEATVEWTSGSQVIEVASADAYVNALALPLHRLNGQFVAEHGQWSLHHVELMLGSSSINLTGSLSGVEALRTRAYGDVALRASVTDTHLDFDELRRVSPALPVRDAIDATLRIQGPLNALVLEEFSVERGNSHLRLGGTVEGLPGEANFQLALHDAALDAEDVSVVAPSVDVAPYAHLGRVRLWTEAEGVMSLSEGSDPAPVVDGRWSIRGDAGSLEGTVSLRPGEERRFGYDVTVSTSGLNPGAALNDPQLQGQVRGQARLSGEADDLLNHRSALALRLGASSIAGRQIDTLRVDARADSMAVEGEFVVGSGFSAVWGNLQAMLYKSPSYNLALQSRSLDAGALLRDDSLFTDLNGSMRITGRGDALNAFRGTLELVTDTSTITFGEDRRHVLPQRTLLKVADTGDGGTVVTLEGDVVEGEMKSSTDPIDASRSLIAWIRLAGDSFAQQWLKPYPAANGSTASDELASSVELDRYLESEQLRLVAERHPTALSGHVNIKRPEAVTAFLPSIPPVVSPLDGRVALTSTGERFEGQVHVRTDSLRLRGVVLDEVVADLHAAGSSSNAPADAARLALDVRAERLHWGSQELRDVRLSGEVEDELGRLDLAAGDTSGDGVALAARLEALEEKTRLVFSRVRYATRDYVWQNASDEVVDVYAGAAAARQFRLIKSGPEQVGRQQIVVDGTLSNAPADTLVLTADGVEIDQLAETLGGPSIGGSIDGRIALTGGLYRPELTGNLHVHQLRFDNRLLGDAVVRSEYVAGTPDIRLDARVDRTQSPEIAEELLEEHNVLRLGGLISMPVYGDAGERLRPGTLDLSIEAERADLFFFEYLFSNLADVEGFATGNGSITGTFRKPIFEAALRLADAEVAVPDYNLRLTANADVHVDEAGIHVRNGVLRDKTGGRATIEGAVLFNDYRYFSLDLDAALDDLQILDVTSLRSDLSFYGRIWASGHAQLRGPIHDATLQSSDVVTSPQSEIYIPLTEAGAQTDPSFIVFADSAGVIPDLRTISRRENVLAERPAGERPFVDALEMDLNIFAPPGSTVHLVIDPLLGDMINAVGSGRIQLMRTGGEFSTYGTLDVTAGDYLFTAGDVFMRRFQIDSGTIKWDGDPTNAQLDISASYRTRASSAGLPGLAADTDSSPLIPLIVQLHITGRVSSPSVGLTLALERHDRDVVAQGLEAILNDPERATQYATSVLLTNTFLLTTEQFGDGEPGRNGTRSQFAFNSVSQLVASQINRYLSYALPNVDVNFGLQGERAQDLDVTYGVALRLMDERLVIRGEGIYQNDQQNPTRGEFLVQVRLTPEVSIEMFYRREGDILSDQTLTNTTGAGVSYQTRFTSWQELIDKLF